MLAMSNIKFNLEELRDLYVNKGLSTLEIAKCKNASPAGIKFALHRAGVKMRGFDGNRTIKAVGFTPTKDFMISAMAYFNNIASDAAKHYEVKYATWIDWLIKFDIPRQRPGSVLKGRPSHKRHDIPVSEAIIMSSGGVSYEEIATKYNVSYGVVARRMKEVGHKAPWRRVKDPRFSTHATNKRKVLQQLSIDACEICGESRTLDFAHIKPDAKGGPIEPGNCLVLCPTHHRLYDSSSLTPDELAKIQPKVDLARQSYGDW